MSIQTSAVEAPAASLIAQVPVKAEAKPRRRRGDGGLRHDEKRNLWIATVPRKGQSPRTFYGKTQQEACDKRDEYVLGVKTGRIDESGLVTVVVDLPRHPTLGEWIEYWLEHYIRPTEEGGKAATTYDNYRWVADAHILSRPIAKVRLDNLRVGDIEVWWEALGRRKPRPVGLPSRYKALLVISAAVKKAILRRDVTSLAGNPAQLFRADDRVQKPKAKPKAAPTPEGIRALLDAVRGERLELVVHLGLRLGLRRQEICGLRFGDFDLARGVLLLRRRINRTKVSGLLTRGGTKMHDEDYVAEVPLTNVPLWADLLAEHRARLVAFQAEQAEGHWVGPDPTTPWAWLFPYGNGNECDPNDVYRWFKRQAAKAGIPDKTLHGLRHDCVSLGIAEGMSLWEVSKLVRHSSTNVTESVYGHITSAHTARLYSTVDQAVDRYAASSARVDEATG